MKKLFVLVFTLLIGCVFAYSEVKLGVVNAQELLAKTKKGVEVTKRLSELQNKKQTEMKTMQDEAQKLEKELQSPALNEDAREKKTLELDAKQKNIKRYLEDARNEWEREYQKEMMEFEKDLMPIIESVGKAKGFTLIFDVSGRGGIIYVDPTTDITEEVVKAVDAKFPK
ncbi:MAG: OmpH family outer membrane protein [Candidatus Omnitrophota bacterium]